MIKSPCKDCQRREAGCHGRCEAYKEFEDAKRVEYAQRAERCVIDTYSERKESALRQSITRKARRAGR